jgi:serine/threonine protein kinase
LLLLQGHFFEVGRGSNCEGVKKLQLGNPHIQSQLQQLEAAGCMFVPAASISSGTAAVKEVQLYSRGNGIDPRAWVAARNEARILHLLAQPQRRSQHVVRGLACIQHSGNIQIVTELLPNAVPFSSPRRSPQELRWSLQRFRELLLGLQELHSAGVVHGDLSGSNTVAYRLTPLGADTAAILDLGSAALVWEQRPVVTTLAYQAPEQLRDPSHAPGTFATDIYAITGVLGLMLTGRQPHHGGLRSWRRPALCRLPAVRAYQRYAPLQPERA